MVLTWDDPEGIAFELLQTHPDTDPLDLNFVDLHALVVDLPGIRGRSRGGQRDKARSDRPGVE